MKLRTIPWLLLTGLTVGFAAHAGEPVAAGTDNDAGYAPGMKAAIDPATGRLRQPSAVEMRALQAKASQGRMTTLRGVVPRNEAEARRTLRKLPRGGYQIRVPEDRMSTLTATTQADGSVRVQHGGADGQAAPTSSQEAGHE
jgi:hypothetical protein